jgi:hypothetical protein
LQEAVRIIDRDGTDGDMVRKTGLRPRDARRARLMMREGLLRLNPDRKLRVDDRVYYERRKYVLRYLNGPGSAWLDPIETLDVSRARPS